MANVIASGSWVILQFGDGRQFLAQAECKKTFRLNRNAFKLDALVGASYGAIFEVAGKDLVRLNYNELYEDASLDQFDEGDAEDHIDNRDFTDTNTAQKLTLTDVEQLKKKGASGKAIIQALTENSDTWDKKTSFSKHKWTAKKLEKYVIRARVVRCNMPTLADLLYHKLLASKGSGVRPDSLAQIMSYGNVTAGSRVLVFDTYGGLVVGAAAERMGGMGPVIQLYTGQQASSENIKYYNLSQDQSDMILPMSASEISACEQRRKAKGQEILLDEGAQKARLARSFLNDDGVVDEDRWRKYWTKQKAKHMKRNQRLEVLRDGLESVILACKHQPLPVLTRLLPFMSNSCPFVVYSDFIEPLVECYTELTDNNAMCGRLQLFSTWLRDYQILPNRSHPCMSMSAHGGYILTGLKMEEVVKEEQEPPATIIETLDAAGNGSAKRRKS